MKYYLAIDIGASSGRHMLSWIEDGKMRLQEVYRFYNGMDQVGYNGVLCAIALGDKTWKGGAWATVAVLLSVLLQIGGMKWGITTLTAPFVVAVWIVAGCRAGWKNRNRN